MAYRVEQAATLAYGVHVIQILLSPLDEVVHIKTGYLEDLLDDIYFDMKSCSKREIKICESLAIKKLKPLKRPDHRWVDILCVLERIKDLWDALMIMKSQIRLYQSDIDITKEMLYTSDESGNQVKCTTDKYWSKVFNLKDDFTNDYKYPISINWSKPALAASMAH
ncbi:hypothetical protein TNCV_410351 [Trichonephila clavipes]|nr:hypothetical protein TNCV_410351 [Trichonephila clavipes]